MALRTPIVVACWSFFVAVVGGGAGGVVGRWLEAGYLPAVRLRGRTTGREVASSAAQDRLGGYDGREFGDGHHARDRYGSFDRRVENDGQLSRGHGNRNACTGAGAHRAETVFWLRFVPSRSNRTRHRNPSRP